VLKALVPRRLFAAICQREGAAAPRLGRQSLFSRGLKSARDEKRELADAGLKAGSTTLYDCLPRSWNTCYG